MSHQSSSTAVQKVREYVDLVDALTESPRYLETLLARDRVKPLITERELSLVDTESVVAADVRLKRFSKHLTRRDAKERAQLRAALNPDEDCWWWRPSHSPVWKIAAVAIFALAAALAATFTTKTLAKNPDAWGIASVVAQAGLTVFAGATLTSAGKRWIEMFAVRTGLTETTPIVSLAVAIVVLLATVLSWYYVPDALAERYRLQALKFCPDNKPCNDIPKALTLFERASSLPTKDRTNASVVHYNFGRVYELAHDYDQAIDHYRSAIQLDPDSPAALNNWAWLLLIEGKDTDIVLDLLDEAVFRADKRLKYKAGPAIYKNRGFANYRGGFYDLAERDLQTSIRLQQNLDGGDVKAAHCLLAAVLEKTGRRAEAIAEAGNCVKLSSPPSSTDGFAPKVDPESFRLAAGLLESSSTPSVQQRQ